MQTMKGRKNPTFMDIARVAGVGTATVERVLNERGNVSPATAEKVLVAARKLRLNRHLPDAYRELIRIEVIMTHPEASFFARLNQAFKEAAATLDKCVVVHRTFVDENAPEAVARHVARPAVPRSGLIAVVQDHPAIVAALHEVRAKSVPTVLLVSNIEGVEGAIYVGIDNVSAGRTAGFFMSSLLCGRAGNLLALCNSGAYRVHRERIAGFSGYLLGQGDGRLSTVLFGKDDPDLSYRVVLEALDRTPDVVGIYNAGGANRAVVAALAARGLLGNTLFIGHELTPRAAGFLRSGAMGLVIDQAPELQARRSLNAILSSIGLADMAIDRAPIPFRIVTAENIA